MQASQQPKYLVGEFQISVFLKHLFSETNDNIRHILSDACNSVLNKYQMDYSYPQNDLGAELHALYEKISYYYQYVERFLFAYRPCEKLAILMKDANDAVRGIFAFLRTYTKQKKDYMEEKVHEMSERLEGRQMGRCNRCKKFVYLQNIEQTKMLLGVGQFYDPFQMFQSGVSELVNTRNLSEEKEHKLRFAEVWDNKRKVQEKIHMMIVDLDKRKYGLNFTMEGIQKIDGVMRHILMDSSQSREENLIKKEEFIDGSVKQLIEIIYKKVKTYSASNCHQEIQVDLTAEYKNTMQQLQTQNEKLGKKVQEQKKKLISKERELAELLMKIGKQQQVIAKTELERNSLEATVKSLAAQSMDVERKLVTVNNSIRMSELRFKDLQKQNEALKAQLLSYAHPKKQSILSTKNKFIQRLTKQGKAQKTNPIIQSKKTLGIIEQQKPMHRASSLIHNIEQHPSLAKQAEQQAKQSSKRLVRNNSESKPLTADKKAGSQHEDKKCEIRCERSQVSIDLGTENAYENELSDRMETIKSLKKSRKAIKSFKKIQRADEINNKDDIETEKIEQVTIDNRDVVQQLPQHQSFKKKAHAEQLQPYTQTPKSIPREPLPSRKREKKPSQSLHLEPSKSHKASPIKPLNEATNTLGRATMSKLKKTGHLSQMMREQNRVSRGLPGIRHHPQPRLSKHRQQASTDDLASVKQSYENSCRFLYDYFVALLHEGGLLIKFEIFKENLERLAVRLFMSSEGKTADMSNTACTSLAVSCGTSEARVADILEQRFKTMMEQPMRVKKLLCNTDSSNSEKEGGIWKQAKAQSVGLHPGKQQYTDSPKNIISIIKLKDTINETLFNISNKHNFAEQMFSDSHNHMLPEQQNLETSNLFPKQASNMQPQRTLNPDQLTNILSKPQIRYTKLIALLLAQLHESNPNTYQTIKSLVVQPSALLPRAPGLSPAAGRPHVLRESLINIVLLHRKCNQRRQRATDFAATVKTSPLGFGVTEAARRNKSWALCSHLATFHSTLQSLLPGNTN